jgi:hypothetical protein
MRMLYKDVAFRVTPVSDRDAADMLDQLRGRGDCRPPTADLPWY